MEVGFVLWIGIAIVTAMAASSRGRSAFGWFILGALFSLLALIAVLVLPNRKTTPHPNTHVRCPDCQELVLKEARVCKHCHCRLVPQ